MEAEEFNKIVDNTVKWKISNPPLTVGPYKLTKHAKDNAIWIEKDGVFGGIIDLDKFWSSL